MRYPTVVLCGRTVKVHAPPIKGWHTPVLWANGLHRVTARNPSGHVATFRTFAEALAFAEVPEDAKDLRTCHMGAFATARCFRTCGKRDTPPAGTPVLFARFPSQEREGAHEKSHP